MRHLNTSVHIVVLSGMNRYDWKWNLADVVQDKDVTVFSTFSCGGGGQQHGLQKSRF